MHEAPRNVARNAKKQKLAFLAVARHLLLAVLAACLVAPASAQSRCVCTNEQELVFGGFADNASDFQENLLPQALAESDLSVDVSGRAQWNITYHVRMDRTGRACEVTLLRSRAPDGLAETITDVLQGHLFFDPSYAAQLGDHCWKTTALVRPQEFRRGNALASRAQQREALRAREEDRRGTYTLPTQAVQAAEQHQAEGVNALRAGDDEAAVQSFTAALQALPSQRDLIRDGLLREGQSLSEEHGRALARLYARRGWAHLHDDHIGNAIRDLLQAREHYDLPYVHVALGEAYRMQMDDQGNREALLSAREGAEQAYESAIEHYPYDARLHYALASALFSYCTDRRAPTRGCGGQGGTLDEARQHLFDAVRLDREYVEAYMLQALVFLELGNNQISPTTAAERAVELQPENPEAHYVLGLVASRSEYTRNEAVQHAQRALELDPGNERYAHAAEQWARPKVDPLTAFIGGLFFLSLLADGDGAPPVQSGTPGYDPLRTMQETCGLVSPVGC